RLRHLESALQVVLYRVRLTVFWLRLYKTHMEKRHRQCLPGGGGHCPLPIQSYATDIKINEKPYYVQ
ncbi:hypothetical protein AVEN_130067-1, partial [Araneus ventricosus]